MTTTAKMAASERCSVEERISTIAGNGSGDRSEVEVLSLVRGVVAAI